MCKLFVPTKEKTKAQAMVEFALVLPILLMLIYGMMEVGRLLFIYASTISAARQAARYGAATGTSPNDMPYYQDCAGIESSARRLGFVNRFQAVTIAYDAGVLDANGTPDYRTDVTDATTCGAFSTAQNGDRIRVNVVAHWEPMTPLVPLTGFDISATSKRTILVSVNIAVTGMPEDFGGTGGVPSLSITASSATYDKAVEDVITYTYIITNIGDDDLNATFNVTNGTGSTVVITCPASPGSLAPGATFTCTGTYEITQPDIDRGYLTIIGVGAPSGASTTQAVTITAIQNGSLSLTKTPSAPQSVTTVTYTYVLTNTGNVTLSSDNLSFYQITDDKFKPGLICKGGSGGLPVQIAPGDTVTCTGEYSITDKDRENGVVKNIATATASYNRLVDFATDSYAQTSVEATAEAEVTTSPIILHIAGILNKGAAPYTNQQITYTFSVENIGDSDLDLTGIAVNYFTGHGTMPTTITCSGTITAKGTGPTSTLTCPSSIIYDVVQADLDAVNPSGVGEPIKITATATAETISGKTIIYTSTNILYSVDLYRAPALTLATSTSLNPAAVPPPTTTAVTETIGAVVYYTYTITNTGNVTLQPPTPPGSFVVTDTQISNAITCTATPIPPGTTKNCKGTRTILAEDILNGSVIGEAKATAAFGNTTYPATATSLTLTSTVPRLTMEITTPSPLVVGVGVTITYSYILTNTGNMALSTAVDTPYDFTGSPLRGYPTCTVYTLAIGESTTCTGTYKTTVSDMTVGFVTNSVSATAYTSATPPGAVVAHAAVTVTVATPTSCRVSHGELKLETINGVPTFGMTINNNNEYAIDVSSITITYYDSPEDQQITELTLGTGNMLWAKPDQTMSGSYTFNLGVFVGNYTLAPGVSNVNLYVSDWAFPYTSNGLEHITVTFDETTCPPAPGDPGPVTLDSGVPSEVFKADLLIEKSNGTDGVDAGGITTYTVKVTNLGPTLAVDFAKIIDAVAPGLKKTSVVCSSPMTAPGQQCNMPPTVKQLETGNFPLPNLNPGDFYEIKVTAIVTGLAGTSVTNSATVSPPIGITDENMNNNEDSDVDAVGANANLAVTKSSDVVGSIKTGKQIVYTVVVTNNGPASADKTIFKDALVSGLNVTNVTCSASLSPAAACPTVLTVGNIQTGVEIPTLPKDGNVTFTLTGTVSTTYFTSFPATLTNQATATTLSGFSTSASKSDTVNSICSGGELTLVSPSPLSGANNYTWTIHNNTTIPLHLTGIDVTWVSNGASTLDTVQLAGATIASPGLSKPSASVSGNWTINPDVGGVGTTLKLIFSKTVSVTDFALAFQEAGCSLGTTAAASYADLGITKTNAPTTSVSTGSQITYTIVVHNYGPAAANGAIFTDPPITGFDVGNTASDVTCGSAANGAVCPTATKALMQGTGIVIGTLPVNGSVTFTVKGTVNAAASGSLKNTAHIQPPEGVIDDNASSGPDLAEATNTVTSSVCSAGALTLSATPVIPTSAGTSFTWTITNSTGTALTLTEINVTWSSTATGNPAPKLTRIDVGSNFVNANSTSSPSNNTVNWTVGIGNTSLVITFNNALSHVDGLTLNFQQSGCSIVKP